MATTGQEPGGIPPLASRHLPWSRGCSVVSEAWLVAGSSCGRSRGLGLQRRSGGAPPQESQTSLALIYLSFFLSFSLSFFLSFFLSFSLCVFLHLRHACCVLLSFCVLCLKIGQRCCSPVDSAAVVLQEGPLPPTHSWRSPWHGPVHPMLKLFLGRSFQVVARRLPNGEAARDSRCPDRCCGEH